MITLKIFRSMLVAFVLVSLLGGCVTKPQQTSSDMTKPSPAPTGQDIEQKQQQAPAAPPEYSDQGTTSPSQDPSRSAVFEHREPANVLMIAVSPSDMEFVQQRLNEYQNELDQWLRISQIDQESKLAEELSTRGIECVHLLERLLTGYSLLLERMQQSETVPVDKIFTIDPKKMQQLDIAYLESRCNEILTMTTPAENELATGEEQQSSFLDAQKTIITYVNSENYKEAILEYSNLLENYPGQKPEIYTELNYGLALQYSGQPEEAAKHFSKMLVSGDLSVEPLRLQLEIADLLLASSNIAAAESYYESFILAEKSIEAEKSWAMEQLEFLRSVEPESEEMLAYTALLREFQVYDYRIHSVALNEKINVFVTEHAGQPIAERALRLKAFTIEQLNSWFGRQLVKINFLVADKRFSEAVDILKNMTHYYLPADLQAIVQKTYYEVVQAEMQENETQQRIQEMELIEQWDTAVNLMDSQNFDDAILAFEALMGTEYEEKASTKIVEAANLAAGQMRKEAAALFIRAGRTSDYEEKTELLLNSHRMLSEILVRYPQTDLLGKVQQNIAILEEHIKKFDPALLEKLQEEKLQRENSATEPDGAADPFSSQMIQ